MTSVEDVRQVVSDGLRELAEELRLGHSITKAAAIRLLHKAANLLDEQPSPLRDSLVHINVNVGNVRTGKDLETVKRVAAALKTLMEPDAKDAIPPGPEGATAKPPPDVIVQERERVLALIDSHVAKYLNAGEQVRFQEVVDWIKDDARASRPLDTR